MSEEAWSVARSLEFVKGKVPLVDFRVVRSASRALTVAREFGFPVVVKVDSAGVVHKSDAGGVHVVHTAEELREACEKIFSLASDVKCVVQPFVEGSEWVVGVQRDPAFGPVVMVGFGGVFVELFGDVSFRACPVSRQEALRMLDDLQAKSLLSGFRGKRHDKRFLAKVVSEVSRLAEPGLESLDLNPVIVQEERGVVVDARIVWNHDA